VDLLVIGGSGFLGRRITRQARLAGHSVIATGHANVPSTVGVDWRMVDIRRRDDVTALALDARPDVIINAASRQSDWETTADAVRCRQGRGGDRGQVHHPGRRYRQDLADRRRRRLQA
jgi:nucleoside-diphosphate-sugar epimerase